MAAGNTYVALASTTLSGTANSVTFSSIPGTYTDLVLVIIGQQYTSTSYGDNFLKFNGDTGSNYSTTILQGNGTTASSSRQYTAFFGTLLDAGVGSPQTSTIIAHIMNYANTTTYKTTISRDGLAAFLTKAHVSLWRNTAAITSLEVSTGDIPFNIGFTMSLYGIAAA